MELALSGPIFGKQPDFDAKALLVTEPERIQVDDVGIKVYQYSEPFVPETLEPFFDSLARVRSADAAH